ncbi:MAG: FeoA domain-containing protein [Chloroflexi bacterium]|nr:FeoA domain-containing protein [Chloroflexota bacterium]
MVLEEKAEEILETLWISTVERKREGVSLRELADFGTGPIEQLRQAGYVSVADDRVVLTDAGRPEAENVVRRHRLAERLLADVLGTGDMLMHEKACKFEHLLDRGLDESICILLGHPKVCPHGSPIPPGRCCQEKQTQAQKVVFPLSQLTRGQKGKVAYIYAPESGKLLKLMAMGILPGAPISLIQSFPSYVFQAGQSQFAVDQEVADAVYVRLVSEGNNYAENRTPAWGRSRRLERLFRRQRGK